jgi:hypothetical protein
LFIEILPVNRRYVLALIVPVLIHRIAAATMVLCETEDLLLEAEPQIPPLRSASVGMTIHFGLTFILLLL